MPATLRHSSNSAASGQRSRCATTAPMPRSRSLAPCSCSSSRARVRSRRVETPAIKGAAGSSPRVACRLLLVIVRASSQSLDVLAPRRSSLQAIGIGRSAVIAAAQMHGYEQSAPPLLLSTDAGAALAPIARWQTPAMRPTRGRDPARRQGRDDGARACCRRPAAGSRRRSRGTWRPSRAARHRRRRSRPRRRARRLAPPSGAQVRSDAQDALDLGSLRRRRPALRPRTLTGVLRAGLGARLPARAAARQMIFRPRRRFAGRGDACRDRAAGCPSSVTPPGAAVPSRRGPPPSPESSRAARRPVASHL
jgi:hypothetical protein